MTEEEQEEEAVCECPDCMCVHCHEQKPDCECDKCEVCEETVYDCECPACDYCGESYDELYGNYCDHCGEHHCENHHNACGCACEECGEMPDYCECGSGFGDSDTPPWERRGIKVETGDQTAHWTTLFPTLSEFDPIQTAADFYLLETVMNDVPFSGNRPQPVSAWVSNPEVDQRIAAILELTDDQLAFWVKKRDKVVKPSKVAEAIAEAKALFPDLVEHADSHLVPYFHMAIGGELRHHRAIGHRILSSSRDYAWCGWMTIYEKVGNGVYHDAAELFREFGGGSYGGENWAVPSEIFYSRLEGEFCPKGDPDSLTNKHIFVDRAWTLQHNGGCFLNKVMWAQKPGNTIGNINNMQTLLNAHAADPTDYQTLVGAASDEVKRIFQSYWAGSVKELKAAGYELPEGMEGVGKPRPVCRHCGSNPTIGHTMSCAWIAKKLMFGDPTETVVPEAFAMHSFHNWVAKSSATAFSGKGIKRYYFTEDGNINPYYVVESGTRFTLRWSCTTPKGDCTYKWEGTVGAFINGECSISVADILHMNQNDSGDSAAKEAMLYCEDDPSSLKVRYRINGDDDVFGGGWLTATYDPDDLTATINWADTGFGAFIAEKLRTKMGV